MMKHVSPENYSVAWFKLAECVSRGEKERAFGVYRLLSHSIDDRAVAIQLQGDLFLVFSMQKEALDCYEKSVKYYKQQGRLLQAASVYEHLTTLNPHDMHIKKELLGLYAQLQFEERVKDFVCLLVTYFCKQGQFDSIRSILSLVAKLEAYIAQATCYKAVFDSVIALKEVHTHIVTVCIEYVIKALLHVQDDKALQSFLAKLQAMNSTWHEAAVAIVKKK